MISQDLGARRRRSFAAAAISAFAVGAAAAPAEALLLVYEPFAYDTGVLAGDTATGQNLTGSWAGSAAPPGFELVVAAPGLDHGSLVGAPAPAGNRLSQDLGTTGASVTAAIDQDVSVAPGEATFFSALLRLDDSANGNRLASITLSGAEGEIGFGERSVGVRALGVTAQTAATGGSLQSDSADLAFKNGDLLFMIGRYVNSATALGDALELIVYDTADADVLPGAFMPSDPNAEIAFRLDGLDIDLAAISAITFSIRGTADNFVDELRIGTTYSDVAPEPGVAVLLGVAFAGAALARARSRS